jgi:hypothetical protein
MLQQLAYTLPSFPGFTAPKTYAAWPVWRDSTTEKVRFSPMPKKQAVKLFHKARRFERQTRQPGQQDGALGRNGLAVLHTLLFDCLNYASGRLDPAQSTIARKACISLRSVARGLVKLKVAGVLCWIRRAGETRDALGRFCLKQDTNAYGVCPSSQWLGFCELPDPPPPDPGTWGDHPSLPDVIAQAAEETRHGGRLAGLVTILEADPGDELAARLARLGRAVAEREAREAQKPQ